MTRMMASVADAGEALIALAGGADMIDVFDPARTAEVMAAVRDRVSTDGAFISRVFVSADGQIASPVPGTQTIAVFPPDREVDYDALSLAARAGCAGAMLDFSRSDHRGLLGVTDLPSLRRFVIATQAHGLLAGLAGGLEPPDVPRLMVLNPDFLGFRRALRGTGGITRKRVAAVRALIPRTDHPDDAGKTTGSTDVVFVHGLILPARIGAYARERDAPQRVRFDVDATVARLARPTQDMRDVFSYDLISDGIRMIVAAGYVPLVETLADRVAAMVLTHPRVTKVFVRVEKLDLGVGTVGVAIERTAADR